VSINTRVRTNVHGRCESPAPKSPDPTHSRDNQTKTLWNTARDSEMQRPLTRVEMIRGQQGISHEQIAEDRLWNKRPDGIEFKIPTDTKSGVICLLEFKRMSDVTSHYIVRTKSVSVSQYESLRSVLAKSMQLSGWVVTNAALSRQRGP
jgi:hypothetical protein